MILIFIFGIIFSSHFIFADNNGDDVGKNSGSNSENSNKDFNSNEDKNEDNGKEVENEFEFEGEREFVDENGIEHKIKVKIESKEENSNNERKLKFESENDENETETEEVEIEEGLKIEIENETEADNETATNKTKIKIKTKDGNKVEIKVLPSTASERAREIFESRNFTIILKEIGHKNIPRVVYHIEGNKTGKFLGIFKMEAEIQGDVDAETGEILNKNVPWWAFLLFMDNSQNNGTDEPPVNNTMPEINNTNINETIVNSTNSST